MTRSRKATCQAVVIFLIGCVVMLAFLAAAYSEPRQCRFMLDDCCSTVAGVAGQSIPVATDHTFLAPCSLTSEARKAGAMACGRYGCERGSERR